MTELNITELNEQLLNTFYKAFQNRDAKAMGACYHSQIEFSDPAFGTLQGENVAAMWQLLCRTSRDLNIDFTVKNVSAEQGTVYWEAFYTYGKSQRKIHNKVKTRIQFRDGKIYRHQDKFSMWRWAAQAMGTNGLLIGWTKFFRKRFQEQSNKLLARFQEKQKIKPPSS